MKKQNSKGKKQETQPATPSEGMPLNKFLAHCGVASRRQAAELIKQGLVTVNGEAIANPGHRVSASDKVTFKGEVVRLEERKVYLLLNKPKNVITTSKDERGRQTVLDLIGDSVKERIYPVGRLDRATTGLLLLTNDGELARRLSHPSFEVPKIYHVVLDRPVSDVDLEQIREGLELEDGLVEVDEVDYVQNRGKDEIGIELHVGRNRIVRRIFESLGYEVRRLDRTYFAGLTKKDIPRGRFRFLKKQEIVMLKHFTAKKRVRKKR